MAYELPKWKVPKMWPDSTVFIIGGGPSVKAEDLTPLHTRRVIGANNAYMLGNWVDVLWFGDRCWYDWHESRLPKFSGIIATCHQEHAGMDRLGILYVDKHPKKTMGICKDPAYIAWNKNSGASAINLAIHFGAKRVVLLGFDMKVDENNETHWHGGHQQDRVEYLRGIRGIKIEQQKSPYERFLKCFSYIADDASAMGIEIINTGLESAISEFKKMSLKEVLECY